MLLVTALCSDLYSQLKCTDAFPAKIFAGVSIQLSLLSEAPARGLFWQVLARLFAGQLSFPLYPADGRGGKGVNKTASNCLTN